MEIYENQPGHSNSQPWLLSFTVLVLIVFGALAILQTAALGLLPFLFGISFEQVPYLLGASLDHPNARMAFLFIQGLGGGLGFFVGGWIFIRFVDKKTLRFDKQLKPEKMEQLWIVIPMLIGFILFNSLLVYLNMNVEFPEALSGLEASFRTKEDQLMELTKYLTDFESLGEFLLGVLVIGVLAGIGEEYLFRGIVQPKMHQYTGNAHWGVWITAFIFSAIHFQFYGFLPRLMLGALFGYLYLYSGSLLYPIIAHILNNTLTVTMVYFNKLGLMEFDIEDSNQLYWEYVIVGIVVFLLCWNWFIQSNKKQIYE
ncbi:CPBP family intramembrane metalloprotease [Cyclobacterium sp. 1_MG-2023]|uniref:CPBP family intramembrane glutamic endopeptidase n=1 Tax=Cyclobacterium sp. 1_MG-2023 TaxID=3062681 RepID=UPI0026E2B84C|nr:CPBP family intramembrane glutamic endopeptidase [Cyclobacterium sp. 1_MG-2023]MDO6439990.1 CPBP family intramembrane metalloprotease [Cyclobacterium sp. 1_MG-2023]